MKFASKEVLKCFLLKIQPIINCGETWEAKQHYHYSTRICLLKRSPPTKKNHVFFRLINRKLLRNWRMQKKSIIVSAQKILELDSSIFQWCSQPPKIKLRFPAKNKNSYRILKLFITFITSVSSKNNFKIILPWIFKSKTLIAVAMWTSSAVKKPFSNNF